MSAASREVLQKNSFSPTQQFMDQNNILVLLHEQTFMWTKLFPPSTSKTSLWTLLDQLPTLWNPVEIIFFCFLFIKLIVEIIVMVLKHMEIQSLTGASLGSGKTLLSASYNLFSPSYLMSVLNPQAPLPQGLEPTRLKDEIGDPEEEHLYPIVHHPITALSLFD